jgi:hypothetical protein
MSKHPASKRPTAADAKVETLEGAERVLVGLRGKREAVASRIAANVDARKAVGYEVHAGDDKAAREKLDKLIADSMTLNGELESLDGAIRTAEERCEIARQAEAACAARANAQRLRAQLHGISECTKRLDAAFASVCAEAAELDERTRTARSLGAATPNVEQFESYGTRCLLTWLGKLPPLWARRFEMLQPRERCGFADRWSGWLAGAERGIAAKLGQQKTEAA